MSIDRVHPLKTIWNTLLCSDGMDQFPQGAVGKDDHGQSHRDLPAKNRYSPDPSPEITDRIVGVNCFTSSAL
jgi:hypothetical protein